MTAELQAAGKSIAAIEAAEPEPALGNGGLGRLAACFLDSIATLGLPGDGVGLLYHNGLFRQSFRGRCQTEEPEPWLKKESWLRDTARTFTVPFGGFTVRGKLYELDVPGYGGGKNRLRLFDLDTDGFSPVGPGIEFDKTDVRRNLTPVSYTHLDVYKRQRQCPVCWPPPWRRISRRRGFPWWVWMTGQPGGWPPNICWRKGTGSWG